MSHILIIFMKKTLSILSVACVMFAGQVVLAQGYYYGTPVYGSSAYAATAYSAVSAYPTYRGSCVNLTSDLSYGSKGAHVRQLQTFLVSQNFPGSGAWMITGNFRTATLAAVRNFQQQQGLSVTGVVDATTRAAIYRVSCGGQYGYGTMYPYTMPQYNYTNTSCYYTFPYVCNNSGYGYTYPNYNRVSLTSLSVNSGIPGSSVTIYGSGFDASNNIVYFGSVALSNVPSYNGSSITFTVPTYSTLGTVGVYVTNSRGTSNTLNFSVLTNYGYGCSGQSGQYVYGSYGTPIYGYCPPVTNNPTITYMSPTSGAVGTSVTVYGTGFSAQGNTLRFGSGTITNITSYNGTSLTFTVPSYLTGYTSSAVTAGSYGISVTNSAGYTSNTATFTVTSGATSAPTISNLNGPTSLTTGVQGLWTIRVFNPSSSYMTTSVNWGDSATGYANTAAPQAVYQQGENTLTFTHTYMTAGTYTVVFTVTNSSGQSNTLSATVVVTGSGSYGSVTLTSITPMSARVGTQIMLTGTGFTPLENTVRFGIGGTQHVPSHNGSTIYYTVPSFVSPCDLVTSGGVCAQSIQQILPGPISVYVTNSNGTTNAIQLQIIN